MPQFFASTARGLVDVLNDELKNMGFDKVNKEIGGVSFETNWAGCYKANLTSRLASRILKPVLDFPAYQPEDLYHNIQKHDFTKYIHPDQTLAIEASVNDSKINDQRFLAMKVKDAIVDQFRDKFGTRPNVDNESAHLRVHIKGYKNQFHVSVDTSGTSLFQRGYRTEQGVAPLKENLAAGLVLLSGWDQKSPLVDFMCGSGTILIEAAMMVLNMAPGIHRKGFAFQSWKGFEKSVWEDVVQQAVDQELSESAVKLYGFDSDQRMIKIAKENSRNAGVDGVIEFKKEPVALVENPQPDSKSGVIIVNPPYGARIGEEDSLRDVYKDLGYTLKNKFKGWDCWILSGNKDLIMDLKLKSTRKIFLYNGQIECRFLKYSINS